MNKLNQIEQLIENSEEIIFIIAEHWFSCWDKLRESRFFFCSTSYPTSIRPGHQNGGLAVLCSTSLFSTLEAKPLNDYMINVSIEEISIVAVYLPPSLETNQILSLKLNQEIF